MIKSDSVEKQNQSKYASPAIPAQARLCQTISQLETPMLVIGLPEELTLNLLIDGLQADVCDASLERIGRLARACLELGLQVDLYWQTLETLNLPGRYQHILLGASAWPASIDQKGVNHIQRRLERLLTPGGQVRLLASNYSIPYERQRSLSGNKG